MAGDPSSGAHWKQFIAERGIENGLQSVTQKILKSPDCLYLKKSCKFVQSYKKFLIFLIYIEKKCRGSVKKGFFRWPTKKTKKGSPNNESVLDMRFKKSFKSNISACKDTNYLEKKRIFATNFK